MREDVLKIMKKNLHFKRFCLMHLYRVQGQSLLGLKFHFTMNFSMLSVYFKKKIFDLFLLR